MKTADQWLDDLGYIAIDLKIREVRLKQIRQYQIDALEQAATLIIENIDSQERAFSEIKKLIATLKNEI